MVRRETRVARANFFFELKTKCDRLVKALKDVAQGLGITVQNNNVEHTTCQMLNVSNIS